MGGGQALGEYIYNEAEQLHRELDTRNPVELLGHIGADVIYSDKFSINGLKGFCTIQNRSKYVVINAKLSKHEKRIVAGHEAGHLILHTHEIKRRPHQTLSDCYLYGNVGGIEYEANMFAADFMIEDNDVLEYVRDEYMDYFKMASALHVPPQLLDFKLRSMERRGHDVRPPVGLDSKFLK